MILFQFNPPPPKKKKISISPKPKLCHGHMGKHRQDLQEFFNRWHGHEHFHVFIRNKMEVSLNTTCFVLSRMTLLKVYLSGKVSVNTRSCMLSKRVLCFICCRFSMRYLIFQIEILQKCKPQCKGCRNKIVEKLQLLLKLGFVLIAVIVRENPKQVYLFN